MFYWTLLLFFLCCCRHIVSNPLTPVFLSLRLCAPFSSFHEIYHYRSIKLLFQIQPWKNPIHGIKFRSSCKSIQHLRWIGHHHWDIIPWHNCNQHPTQLQTNVIVAFTFSSRWCFTPLDCLNWLMIQFFLVGCGSGLSGETLSENEHHWIGLDISKSMLGLWTVGFEVTWIVCVGLPVICLCFNGYFSTDVALEREVDGDLLLADMGQVWGLSIHVEMYDWFCLCFSFPFGSSVVYFRLDHQIRKKKSNVGKAALINAQFLCWSS